MHFDSTTEPGKSEAIKPRRGVAPELITALVVVWCPSEPHRVGEAALLFPEDTCSRKTLGRMGTVADERRLVLWRDRPSGRLATGPLRSRHISREHLLLRLEPSGAVDIRNVGRCPMLIDGETCTQAHLRPGQLVELHRRVLFLCVRRAAWPPYWARSAVANHPFGRADAHGIVGEGRATWRLRGRIADTARRPDPLLIAGYEGSGQDRVAQALHEQSSRHRHSLVHYQPGNPRRLTQALTRARGSTLYIDDLFALTQGEQLLLAEAAAAQTRTGRDGRRPPRLLGSTASEVDTLPERVRAVFKTHLVVPGLHERLEDLPLMAQHVLQLQNPGTRRWRLSSALITQLLHEEYLIDDQFEAFERSLHQGIKRLGLTAPTTTSDLSTGVWSHTAPPDEG